MSRNIGEVTVLYTIMKRIMRSMPATVAVCAVVACATGPRKTPEQRQADSEMADRVQLALNSDRVLYARHITIRADGGVVTLGGYVWSPEDLIQAKEDAGAVPGVAKIVDRMEIDRGAVSDSAVTR
jgi:osmotically-inducible protein OsmY